MRRECFRCLCLFPFIYEECTSRQNDGEDSGKSPSPQQSLLRDVGLVPGTLPWAAGAGGCRDIPAPNPRTLLPQFSWLCNGAGRRAGLRGPCLTAPSQRLIGHRLPGAAPPWPLKGALYHHKEALSLLKNPGCCHGDRGGEGGSPCVERKGHSRQRALVHTGQWPVWVLAILPSCDPRLD